MHSAVFWWFLVRDYSCYPLRREKSRDLDILLISCVRRGHVHKTLLLSRHSQEVNMTLDRTRMESYFASGDNASVSKAWNLVNVNLDRHNPHRGNRTQTLPDRQFARA
jgi:hypothetical protein